jgi:very-short-patch-repair endonuclease
MGYQNVPRTRSGVWDLAARQHGVVTRPQLLELGYTPKAILHRIRRGRLHAIASGVYVVGRPELSQRGRWMAAVLACGSEAALSDGAGAALWAMRPSDGPIEITVPHGVRPRRPGIIVHRRTLAPDDVTTHHGIPVTTPARTLIDLAVQLPRPQLERAINEADKLDLVDPETLRAYLVDAVRRPGVVNLRQTLDRRTFALTDSELERRFLPIARRAGLPLPETGAQLNGFKVDFYWRELGLVVETDGIRYHRTPAEQTRDRIRDQVHTAAGLTPLRFTRSQVAYEPRYVEATLARVANRLTGARP